MASERSSVGSTGAATMKYEENENSAEQFTSDNNGRAEGHDDSGAASAQIARELAGGGGDSGEGGTDESVGDAEGSGYVEETAKPAVNRTTLVMFTVL